ncbi:MAG: ABC transporter permease [bacterium]
MKVVAIAKNTFLEAIRDRILYNLLIFALIIIGISTILGNFTIGEQKRIILDVGLSSISIFGVLIAVFVGINLVYKEISKKTIYNIISKPVTRYQFIFGKYFGLLFTLFVNVFIMAVGFLSILFYLYGSFNVQVFLAIGLTFMELMIITSIAIMFSTFSTPTLSAIFTLSVFVIGHLTHDLMLLRNKVESSIVRFMLTGFYYILPNLDNFNIRNQVVHQLPIKFRYIQYATSYGVIYLCIIFIISIIIFNKREFK